VQLPWKLTVVADRANTAPNMPGSAPLSASGHGALKRLPHILRAAVTGKPLGLGARSARNISSGLGSANTVVPSSILLSKTDRYCRMPSAPILALLSSAKIYPYSREVYLASLARCLTSGHPSQGLPSPWLGWHHLLILRELPYAADSGLPEIAKWIARHCRTLPPL
jgi:hypothetical protein